MKSSRLVSHPVFGEGEVLDTRWGGTELLVRFATGLRLWLPTRRVRMMHHVADELFGKGKLTVEVNPEPTHLTHVVDFPLHGPAGEWLPRIAEAPLDRSEARPTQERDRSP